MKQIISRDSAVIRIRSDFQRIPVKSAIRLIDPYCMARNFYFGADATMVSGSAAFSSLINADAAAFGLSDEQALAYATIDAALQSAYLAVVNPSTRSSVAVAHKNAAIKSMQRRARLLSEIIREKSTVTDAQLISLGLLARAKRTRRNVPDASPAVRVISVNGRIVNFRVCGRDSSSGRSKPFGARSAHLYSYVGEQAPTDPGAYQFEFCTSRTTAQITFPNDIPSGTTVWLSARWVSARGEASIASAPIPFTLTGGAIRPAAPAILRAAA